MDTNEIYQAVVELEHKINELVAEAEMEGLPELADKLEDAHLALNGILY